MKLILDTHIFLWFISGDNRLPDDMRDSIRDSGNEVYLSVVSLWEIIVKHQLGKLPLPHPPESYIPLQRDRHQISSLTLDESSVSQLAKLPSIHRDPFDRMLICQAVEHRMTIVTVDNIISSYPVTILKEVEEGSE
ncbi:MAG: type II toxin-antitoxin system VapC family toxin [Pyrinomonadaceae bacterium]|nr:type II toxin-antitoxin system VapC family toxin [Pyrinomonadaceae bacterium]